MKCTCVYEMKDFSMFGKSEVESTKGKYNITQNQKKISMFERIKIEITEGRYDITEIQKNSLSKKQLKELEKEHAKLINIYSGLDGDKRDL